MLYIIEFFQCFQEIYISKLSIFLPSNVPVSWSLISVFDKHCLLMFSFMDLPDVGLMPRNRSPPLHSGSVGGARVRRCRPEGHKADTHGHQHISQSVCPGHSVHNIAVRISPNILLLRSVSCYHVFPALVCLGAAAAQVWDQSPADQATVYTDTDAGAGARSVYVEATVHIVYRGHSPHSVWCIEQVHSDYKQ